MADLFQCSLAQLQKVPESGSPSVFEHLTKIVLNILKNRPDSVDLVDTSILCNREASAAAGKVLDPLLPYRSSPDASEAEAALNNFGDVEPSIDPATGVPFKVCAPHAHESEDVSRSSQLFESVGVALSSNEMYSIGLQIKRLGEDPKLKLKSIRFFGKFFGIYADYYVFETTPAVAPAHVEETAEEKAAREAAREYPAEHAKGANAYQYYVTTQFGAAATKLGDVRPEHIRDARHLKRFLTGRLGAAVSTFPSFRWDEATYLRAQIARIAATTVLAPSEWFALEEDDDGKELIKRAADEDIQPVAMPDAGAADEWVSNWVHRYHHLKRQGRCETKPIRELPEDSEEEVELTEEEQEEAPAGGNVLAPASDDAPVYGHAAWTPIFSSKSRFAKGQVSGLRSNLWPGAAVVTHGQQFFNVYVGWGLKNAPYVPMPPPPITEEYDQGKMASVDMPPKADPDAGPPAEAVADE